MNDDMNALQRSASEEADWQQDLLNSLKARHRPEDTKRFLSGRYTLDEASLLLALSLGETAAFESQLRDYMAAAVERSDLRLRDEVTGLLVGEKHQCNGWGVVTRKDVNAWLEGSGSGFRWEDQPASTRGSEDVEGNERGIHQPTRAEAGATPDAPRPTAAKVVPVTDETPPLEDFAELATRKQLIAAFGNFTGMDMTWFKNLKDTPALLKARKVHGVGKRGCTKEPLFCPMEVVLWLMDPKRKRGRPFHSDRKPWELLEKHFPRAYAKHSHGDPREERPG